MADDDEAAARFPEHPGTDFPGKSAFHFPVDVLGGELETASPQKLVNRSEGSEGRGQDDLHAVDRFDPHADLPDEPYSLALGAMHLPVAPDQRRLHFFFSSARVAGRPFPSRNSNVAPPPVERW